MGGFMFSISVVFLIMGLFGCGLIVSLPFIKIGGFELEFVYMFDKVGLLFASMVSLISFSIFIYIRFYMGSMLNFGFNWLVFLFVVSMLLLIFSGNMLSMIIGWDGLGLTSFILVVYYNNTVSVSSGVLTLMINRFGDAFLIMALAMMWSDSYLFDVLNADESLVLISILIILGGMTKSAQYPFSSWLPAAMTAPTPVSSLVHSSTLVTAGIFLFMRLYGMICASGLMMMLMMTGIITMLVGGSMALVESDLKKVIAYSTLSQLGLMVFILSVGEWEMGFFHLISHALFKSLLFMLVGGVMMSSYGAQDNRQVAFISLSSPLLSFLMGVTCLSLAGFPLMGGFISKDVILESCFNESSSWMMSILFYLGCIFTIGYSLKIFYGSTILSESGQNYTSMLNFNELAVSFICLFFLNASFIIICEDLLLGTDLMTGYQDMKVLDLLLIFMGSLLWFFLLGKKFSHSFSIVSDFMFLLVSMWYMNGMANKFLLMFNEKIEQMVESIQSRMVISISMSMAGVSMMQSIEIKKSILFLLVGIYFLFLIY